MISYFLNMFYWFIGNQINLEQWKVKYFRVEKCELERGYYEVVLVFLDLFFLENIS